MHAALLRSGQSGLQPNELGGDLVGPAGANDHIARTLGPAEPLRLHRCGMADPGEKADDGSLLVARYGKGWFTYTGLVFFRELPAGVPGAFRLIANLIALNKKKGF